MADLELTAKIVPMNNAFPDIVDAKNVGGDGTSANALPADTIAGAAANYVLAIDSTGTHVEAISPSTAGLVLTSNGAASPSFQTAQADPTVGAATMIEAPGYPDTSVINTTTPGTIWDYTMPGSELFDPRLDVIHIFLAGVGKQNRGGTSDLTLALQATDDAWVTTVACCSGVTQFGNDTTEFYWEANFHIGPHSASIDAKRCFFDFFSVQSKNTGSVEQMQAMGENIAIAYDPASTWTFRVLATWGNASLNTYLNCRHAAVHRLRTVTTPWGDVI